MPYQTTTYKILIASPNDLTEERIAITEVISLWNATNSEKFNIALLPVMWETHSTPELGDRPQAIINKQMVNSCDILIGVFWTRIGTHTGISESGTVEEIDEFRKAGKPVLLYFSSREIDPSKIDDEQYVKLKAFKTKCQKEGLTDGFKSVSELREKLNRHLTTSVNKLHDNTDITSINISKNENTLEYVLAQTNNLVNEFSYRWNLQQKSNIGDVESGKSLVQHFVEVLIQHRINLEERVDKNQLSQLDSGIAELKNLNRHRLSQDGGASVRAFWNKGDDQLKQIKSIFNQLSNQNDMDANQDLTENDISILKLLSEAEEKGEDTLSESSISSILDFSLTIARYHLSQLEENEYIYGSHDMESQPSYSLIEKGREYLIRNQII